MSARQDGTAVTRQPTLRETVARTAEQWSRASQEGDFEGMLALMAPGATMWRSGGEPPGLFIDAVAGLRATRERAGPWQYLCPRRVVDDHGFCEQHVVRFSRPDGRVRDITACVVAQVGEDGLITRLDEYLDPARDSTWLT
jgi:ketosteroid isomerase-like protein